MPWPGGWRCWNCCLHRCAEASGLEASHVIQRLPPAHRNLSKRLIKSPKLHLLDTRLAPLRGALFESRLAAEVRKWRDNHGLNWLLGFWRDRSDLTVLPWRHLARADTWEDVLRPA
jgi:hypothetical protein